MKRILTMLLAVVVLVGLFSFAALAEQPQATAYRAEQPITIDGDLSEWNMSSPIEINDESQVIRHASAWKGAEDVSCTVYVMWDEDNLYLGVDVYEASALGAVGQLEINMEDNFKIYISTDPDADPERTEYETNDFLLYLMMDPTYWYTAFDRSMIERENLARFTTRGVDARENVLEGYEQAYTPTDYGFIFECAIPWANFSNDYIDLFTPSQGDTVNFNFAITDNDYPFPEGTVAAQLAWTGTTEIETNPSLWGRLTFE